MPYKYYGGVHPDYAKTAAKTPVRTIAPPKEVVIPMVQHIGAPDQPTVKVGDTVTVGQLIGSNDVDGSVSPDAFMADYKQALQNIKSAYSYCDVIACAIPPVTQDSENAAQIQTNIDQFNQSIAAACDEMGYKYLNSPAVLKKTGYWRNLEDDKIEYCIE